MPVMRAELRSMFQLAWPVVLSEVGWVLMGIVDTIMVGPLGPAAIGAVGAGTMLYMLVIMPGFGTLLALDTFVSQSFGAGRIDDCHRWLFAGMQLAAVMTVVLSGLALSLVALMPLLGLHPEVLALIRPYMAHLLWSTPSLLAYVVFRRYLQAMNVVRPVMIALVVANLVNLAANWLLVYGRFGLPAMGVVGSAYATVLSRLGLALVLFLVILYRERERPSGLHDVPFRIDWLRMWALVRLGLPAAGQIVLEVGVFATAAALAGRIAPTAVAAYQIVLNIAGLVFMIPFGISSAAAVRVGQAVGRRDPHGVRVAGWAALFLATGVMLTSATLFATAPGPLVRIFSSDSTVVELGARLLLIAVVFQLFDGVQTVATGALRGLGDTHTPMVWNLAGHWLVGLPLGYWLAFGRSWGVVGLWVGLSLGLIIVGSVLLGAWWRRSAAFVPEF
jgi:MATE family multidrug resistance protein